MEIQRAIVMLEMKADLLRERLNGHLEAIEELKELANEKEEKLKKPRQVEESRGARVRSTITRLLAQEDKGLHRKDLMAKLREEGIYDGTDPQKEMSHMSFQLSSYKRFEPVDQSGSGYWRLTEAARAELRG